MATASSGSAPPRALTSDEGRRVLSNVASFGAFAIAPLQMALLSRALGPAGYGRWWWSFGILEAMMLVGMLGADLFIRRELPRLVADGRDGEIPAVVGSSVALAAATGALFLVAALALARPLAAAQGDPALAQFLTILAAQPLLWNLTNALGAALQSLNVIGVVAVVRGIVVPALQLAALWLAWERGLPTATTLELLLAVSAAAVVLVAVVYARHLSLGRTLAAVARPRYARAALRYGGGLVLPTVLWTLGGKLDLYVLGAHVTPALVGVYAACLQVASLLPNTRVLFDPIVQTQIGGLHGRDHAELAASLQRLARLCALALAPAFVLMVSAGEPILSLLLGHPVPIVAGPLTILLVGQLVGSMAVASWLVPMALPGRVVAVVAGTTLVTKLALLLALVPRWTITGAAVATAVGTIIAQQGQALIGARALGLAPYPRTIAAPLALTCAIAAAGHVAFALLSPSLGDVRAGSLAAAGSLLVYVAALPALLDSAERARLVALVRRA